MPECQAPSLFLVIVPECCQSVNSSSSTGHLIRNKKKKSGLGFLPDHGVRSALTSIFQYIW